MNMVVPFGRLKKTALDSDSGITYYSRIFFNASFSAVKATFRCSIWTEKNKSPPRLLQWSTAQTESRNWFFDKKAKRSSYSYSLSIVRCVHSRSLFHDLLGLGAPVWQSLSVYSHPTVPIADIVPSGNEDEKRVRGHRY